MQNSEKYILGKNFKHMNMNELYKNTIKVNVSQIKMESYIYFLRGLKYFGFIKLKFEI